MIGTIRKHSKWLWVVIIAVTIAGLFYFFLPNTSSSGAGGGKGNFGNINGKEISQDDFFNAQREITLRYFLNSGGWPERDEKQLRLETYQWLLIIQKLDELDIRTSDENVALVANNILRAAGERYLGPGKKLSLNEFGQQVLGQNAGVEDFLRYIRHDLRLQQLISIVGLSGDLVTPKEVQGLYEREHQELSVQAVFFSGSNYLAAAAVTPEAIAHFYTNEMAAYRLPDRVQVAYVHFNVTNFFADADQQMAKMTNLNAQIDAIYEQRGGTNFFKEAKSPEDAKAKIRDGMHREIARLNAQKAASEFTTQLLNQEPLRLENLEKMAKTNDLTVKITAPFDRINGPKDLNVSQNFTKFAFALTPEDPFAGPVEDDVQRNGFYVLAFNNRLPSEIPPLDKIRDQVTADYKYIQAVLLARQAGTNFIRTLAEGIAQKKTFSEICIGANQRPILLPPFSLSTRTNMSQVEEHMNLSQFKELAFATPVGKASTFDFTQEGGVIVYVQQRLFFDETKMKADLPAFTRLVRQERRQEAFNVWFSREIDKLRRENKQLEALQSEMSGGARVPRR